MRRSASSAGRRDVRNISGQAYALTMLAPIVPGREDVLRETVEGFGTGAESPLAKLETTHFARLVIISHCIHQGGRQRREQLANQYLLFSTDFDGPLERYLDAICDRMAAEADALWGHCVGYPGTHDRSAFGHYVRHNQLETKFPFAPYGERTVQEVRSALALRERLIHFAGRTQALPPADLWRSYEQTFGAHAAQPAGEVLPP